MKKLSIIAVLFLSVVLFSCNTGGDKTNEDDGDSTKTEEVANEKELTEEDVDRMNENLPYYKVKAKFYDVTAGSAGAYFNFDDENSEGFSFWDKDTPPKLKEITKDAGPNAHDPKWDNIWFNIEYQKQTVLIYDGSNGKYYPQEKLVITSIEQIGGNKTAGGLTFNEIKNAKFFGTDAMWLIEFKDDNVLYTGTDGSTHKAYYYDTEKMKKTSSSQAQIKFLFDQDKGYISTATITKEPCSDGESDMTHDYSISVKWEDRTHNGCGRKIE